MIRRMAPVQGLEDHAGPLSQLDTSGSDPCDDTEWDVMRQEVCVCVCVCVCFGLVSVCVCFGVCFSVCLCCLCVYVSMLICVFLCVSACFGGPPPNHH